MKQHPKIGVAMIGSSDNFSAIYNGRNSNNNNKVPEK